MILSVRCFVWVIGEDGFAVVIFSNIYVILVGINKGCVVIDRYYFGYAHAITIFGVKQGCQWNGVYIITAWNIGIIAAYCDSSRMSREILSAFDKTTQRTIIHTLPAILNNFVIIMKSPLLYETSKI